LTPNSRQDVLPNVWRRTGGSTDTAAQERSRLSVSRTVNMEFDMFGKKSFYRSLFEEDVSLLEEAFPLRGLQSLLSRK